MRRTVATVATVAAAALAVALPLAAPPAAADTTTARDLLSRLAVAAEAGSATYSRTYFKHWVDADGDCRNTRAEVLVAESADAPVYAPGRCVVVGGRWYSYHDSQMWTDASDVDVAHLVPLKEAWESGARAWSATTRQRYANDLTHPYPLEAITDDVRVAKGDKDPATWLPPLPGVHCKYAIRWVVVKYRWRLTVDPAERSKLASILSGACGDRAVTIPRRAI